MLHIEDFVAWLVSSSVSCIVICDAHCCLFAGGSGLVMMARGLFLNIHFLLITPMTCAGHDLYVPGLESLMGMAYPRGGKKFACTRVGRSGPHGSKQFTDAARPPRGC